MKNYVQNRDKLNVAAPYELASGEGALLGSLFGVAQHDAANGADVALQLDGVVTLAKVGSQAWTVGARVYWDNSNKHCTTTASGNTLIGVATAAVGSGASLTTGTVRLNGSF